MELGFRRADVGPLPLNVRSRHEARREGFTGKETRLKEDVILV